MKLFLKTISILLLTFLLLCPGAFAGLVDITNGSFDSPSVVDPGDWSWGIPGWQGDEFGGIWFPNKGYTMAVPDSIGFLSQGSIWQETTHTIEANNVFTLSLDIGNRSDKVFPTYSVNLMAGDSIVAWDAAPVLFPDPDIGDFSTLTLSYTPLFDAPAIGQFLGIQISSGGVQSLDGSQLNFDNLRVTNDKIPHPTPEPATMLLLGTGLLGLAGYGRKKKFFKK